MYWSSEVKNNICNDLILTVEMEGRVKYAGEWKGNVVEYLKVMCDVFDQVIIIMNGFPDSESGNKFE